MSKSTLRLDFYKECLLPPYDYIRSLFIDIEIYDIKKIIECIQDLLLMLDKLSETYIKSSDDDNEQFLLTILSLFLESNYSLPFAIDTKSERIWAVGVFQRIKIIEMYYNHYYYQYQYYKYKYQYQYHHFHYHHHHYYYY